LVHTVFLFCLRITLALRAPYAVPPTGSLLVLAPHPDDEILGAGGCILAALAQRQRVHIVYLTDGEAACPDYKAEQVISERAKLTHSILKQLDLAEQHCYRLHLPDGSVPHYGQPGFVETVNQLGQLIDRFQPDYVLATSHMDYWPFDHVACAELAEAAIASAGHKPVLYEYWVWAWYQLRPWQLWYKWPPGLFAVNIRPWATRKQVLVKTYLDATSSLGKPWSGVLPGVLRRAFAFNIEVLEKKSIQ